jgi:hypothetical protein
VRSDRPCGRSLDIPGLKGKLETIGQDADKTAYPQLVGLERAHVELER